MEDHLDNLCVAGVSLDTDADKRLVDKVYLPPIGVYHR